MVELSLEERESRLNHEIGRMMFCVGMVKTVDGGLWKWFCGEV